METKKGQMTNQINENLQNLCKNDLELQTRRCQMKEIESEMILFCFVA